MVNQGVEVSVNSDIIRTKDFTWNLNANVSYNKNKLVELVQRRAGVRKLHHRTEIRRRHPVHEFFLNRYAGVNPANGDALWYTKDGELTTEFNESDKVMTGKTFDAVGGRLRHHLCLERAFRCRHSSVDGRPLGDEQRPLF